MVEKITFERLTHNVEAFSLFHFRNCFRVNVQGAPSQPFMLKVILKHYLRFCKSFDPVLLCEILNLIPNKELSSDSGMFEWFFHWAVMNKKVTYEALKALLDNGVRIQVDRFLYSAKQVGD